MVLGKSLLAGYRIFFSIERKWQLMHGHSISCSQVLSGVPQGSVLSSLLLICYINNLPKEVNSTVKLYADDVLLNRVIHSVADHEMLQRYRHY